MKFTAITLITAFFVSTLVLVGVPMYKAWATTPHCLHSGTGAQLNPHPWYPCGWKFTVKHLGYGDLYPCNCNHQALECVEIVFVDYTDETPDFRQAMSYETINTDCGDNNFPEVTYCCYVHVPRGEHYQVWEQGKLVDKYRWKYYFECDGGSRDPVSGFYVFNTSDEEECTEWGGGQCDHDFCEEE